MGRCLRSFLCTKHNRSDIISWPVPMFLYRIQAHLLVVKGTLSSTHSPNWSIHRARCDSVIFMPQPPIDTGGMKQSRCPRASFCLWVRIFTVRPVSPE